MWLVNRFNILWFVLFRFDFVVVRFFNHVVVVTIHGFVVVFSGRFVVAVDCVLGLLGFGLVVGGVPPRLVVVESLLSGGHWGLDVEGVQRLFFLSISNIY